MSNCDSASEQDDQVAISNKITIERLTGYVPADIVFHHLKRASLAERLCLLHKFAQCAGEGRGKYPDYISKLQIQAAMDRAAVVAGADALLRAEAGSLWRKAAANEEASRNERVLQRWFKELAYRVKDHDLNELCDTQISDCAELAAEACTLPPDEIAERFERELGDQTENWKALFLQAAQLGARSRRFYAAETRFADHLDECEEKNLLIFETYEVDPQTNSPSPIEYIDEQAERERAARLGVQEDIFHAAEECLRSKPGLSTPEVLSIARQVARETDWDIFDRSTLEERLAAACRADAELRYAIEMTIEFVRDDAGRTSDVEIEARIRDHLEGSPEAYTDAIHSPATLNPLPQNRAQEQASETPEGCVEPIAEPKATSAFGEASPPSSASAETSSIPATEDKLIRGAVREIRIQPSMLLEIVRDVSHKTALIESDALAAILIRASRNIAEYTNDAIRMSVTEARRDAGPTYDDAAVEARVEAMLVAKYAPITGEVGTREFVAQRVVAEMCPTGARGPTLFAWRDPDSLPPRAWLYGTHLIRKELSATVAPGGGNKTSLCMAEALALASGKPLLGTVPKQRCRVWFWSGEEPMEELQRRILAACRHHGLTRDDVEGWLFVDNFESFDFIIAEQTRDGTKIFQPKIDLLIRWLTNNGIDALFLDPAISTHNVGENDNVAIQKWATAWKAVAVGANVAISIAHHAKKLGGQAAVADDSRGARSFVDKCRVVRSLNPMTKEEADRFGVPVEDRRFFFSTDPTEAKSNMAPAVGGKWWFKSVSVVLGAGRRGNLDLGESVGVVERWTPHTQAEMISADKGEALKKAMGGKEWRAALQSFGRRSDSISVPIADAFDLDLGSAADLQKAKKIFNELKARGTLILGEAPDENYKLKPVVRFADK